MNKSLQLFKILHFGMLKNPELKNINEVKHFKKGGLVADIKYIIYDDNDNNIDNNDDNIDNIDNDNIRL